jgi:hypothetical protein
MAVKLNSLPLLESDNFHSLNSNNLYYFAPDVNLPLQTNFKYCTTQDFHHSNQIQSCISSGSFSALHSNIRSLAANFDSFVHMLNELNQCFSIVGLTETKLNTSREAIYNQYLPGYTFVSQSGHSLGFLSMIQSSQLSRIQHESHATISKSHTISSFTDFFNYIIMCSR